MDFLQLSIESLVPHRGPMCWLDSLTEADADQVTVQAQIRPEQPLVQPQGLPGWAGIELMAQAIAVWAGVRALQRGEPIKPGFLLGSRRYSCDCEYFWLGQRLSIEARCELFGDNGLGLFSCRIYDQQRQWAAANVSVYEPPDPKAFLEHH